MQLSSELLPYEERTILLVCDRMQARLYEAHNREVSLLDTITYNQLPLDENERYSVQVAGERMSKSQDEGLKEREAGDFYKQLAEYLFGLGKRVDYAKLVPVIPKDDQNMLLEALHPDVSTRVDRVVPKQLTKVADDELIKRLDQERRSLSG